MIILLFIYFVSIISWANCYMIFLD